MKKLIIAILFLFVTNTFSQDLFIPTDFFITKRKCEAKMIKKRFDRAVIAKVIVKGQDSGYYIELEENDVDEYYKRLGIKFYCIPKRKRDKIILIMLINDTGEWGDEENYF